MSTEDRRTERKKVEKETSMDRLAKALRRRRKNQKGFTLIEMLVVISILGILAAAVTMSMVGVVNLAQSRANDAELNTIQVAMDTMANEQQVPADKVCPANMTATKQMDSFPNSMPANDQATNQPPIGVSLPLYPRYLRSPSTTKRAYTCDASGKVSPA